MHARLSPTPHRFAYRLFYFAFDLDELPELGRRLALFSCERAGLYSFRDGDFLPTDESRPAPVNRSLKERVTAFAARHGVDLAGGRVTLVTLPRIAGYLFNPVSFYFCTDRDGAPAAVIVEVTNTFREMKPYFLGPGEWQADGAEFRLRLPKHFYVSPFSDVDVAFDFKLRVPAGRLAIQIDDYIGRERTLTTTLTGEQQPLTGGRLAWFTIKYPLLTLRVIALIHWHAFCLWVKRVPWFPKAARASDQRDLYRPHASLLSTSDPA
jgi:DUF1365 family protein